MDLMAGRARPRARRGADAQHDPRRRDAVSLGIPYRDGEPIVYDSGDYPSALKNALDALGGVRRSASASAARGEGRYLGLGIGCYVEGTGVGPFESATVRIDPVRQGLWCRAAPARKGRAWRRSSRRWWPTPGR